MSDRGADAAGLSPRRLLDDPVDGAVVAVLRGYRSGESRRATRDARDRLRAPARRWTRRCGVLRRRGHCSDARRRRRRVLEAHGSPRGAGRVSGADGARAVTFAAKEPGRHGTLRVGRRALGGASCSPLQDRGGEGTIRRCLCARHAAPRHVAHGRVRYLPHDDGPRRRMAGRRGR